MHSLLLLRHAKSDWSTSASDHERPLNARGVKNVPFMAKRLKEHGYRPDMIISSSALRAKSTAEVFADILECELLIDRELYDASEKRIMDLVRKTDEKVKDLMLVGHNPTWENLAEGLSGEKVRMPTCSVVQIAFDCLWKEIKKGEMIHYDYPKNRKS